MRIDHTGPNRPSAKDLDPPTFAHKRTDRPNGQISDPEKPPDHQRGKIEPKLNLPSHCAKILLLF